MKMGHRMPLGICMVVHCECGQQIDGNGFHLLTCKCMGRRTSFGNTVLWFLVGQIAIKNWQFITEKNQRTAIRTAIIVQTSHTIADDTEQSPPCTDVDVSLAHTWCSEIVKRCGNETGFAASKRDKEEREILRRMSGRSEQLNLLPSRIRTF